LTAVSVILYEVLLNLVSMVYALPSPLQPFGYLNAPALGAMANILGNLVIALLLSSWIHESEEKK
ncbi:MAG: hypothetical protein V1847_01925, partial [Candidatus Diapherotrites archaeon]